MRQPVLRHRLDVIVLALASVVFYVGGGSNGKWMRLHLWSAFRVPFVFGTIVVQNMLQGIAVCEMDAADERRTERDRRDRYWPVASRLYGALGAFGHRNA